MTNEHANLTFEQLWQFSLQYYAMPEIKEACLSLQNRYHGNVNLLLLLKWLDEQQYSLDQNDFAALKHALARTEQLLEPYRELRRQCKRHLPDTLYRQALQFELQLEQQQQIDLINTLPTLNLSPSQAGSLTERYCIELDSAHLIPLFNSPTLWQRQA